VGTRHQNSMFKNMKMLKIHVNGYVIQFDLYHIDMKNFIRIQDYFIKEYGFKYWLGCLYFVRHKDELEEKEYEEACEFLMNL